MGRFSATNITPTVPGPQCEPITGPIIWRLILASGRFSLISSAKKSPSSKIPVQTVAVCGYLEPLSAVVFAALLLGEEMTVIQIIGAACIIGGAMIGELVKPKRA